ncbi:serum factor response C isoform X1 [Spatholobus suberectus]|nr:serum factor response C isoform X1 [Spatholobus suberectus]
MSNNTNSSSKTQPTFMNAPNPNHQLFLQNNGVGMQPQPQLGAGNHQGQNLMPPFVQLPMNAAPFMNAANHNHFPLQNNQLHLPHMGQPHMGGLGPQNSVGNANYNNPMFPVQGQVMQNAAQLNLSQLQGQILAQSIMNMLQQPNMNMSMSMPNGQFCSPYPMQNMNQQLPVQMPNPSQVAPYGMQMHPGSCPMFGFPNQVPQAVVPQNSMFSANPQLGLVPRNQAGPQIDLNEKNLAPPTVNTNAFVSSPPFSSQQLQGNTSGSFNPNLAHTSNSQPPAFMKSHSQENPNSNMKTKVPNSNWKGSPSKNFKNKPNRGGYQGGFQKSKFHEVNNGKRRIGFPKEHNGKGLNSARAGQYGLKSKELKQEPERSFSVTYTEQEIQQWREARKKNHPFSNNIQKHSERPKDSKVINREVLQRELKEVLAKQAELGLEVAEVPSYYLKNSENQGLQSEGKNKYTDKRKFQNMFNKKSDRKGRFAKKQKFADKDSSEGPTLKKRKPTLLQKLLSADIKRDKSHLFQVFRFMVMNSFFKHCPDKPLRYPSVVFKENGSEVDGEGKYLHARKVVLKRGSEETVQKIVNLNNDNGHGSEDEDNDDDENESIVDNNPHKEPSSLVKRQCESGEGIEKSDEEEGEIIE